ncbi:hypothetical protein CVT25_003466, partial [Psilocybe cyanescens]
DIQSIHTNDLATGEVTTLTAINTDTTSTISQAGISLDKRLGQLVLTCYNVGTPINRGTVTTVIDNWCNNYMIGRTVWPDNGYWVDV